MAEVQVGKPITLIPVGLKEAALDSPTFRSGFTHFSDQLELVEKWLESYVKCITKLSHEVGAFESLITGFLCQAVPPTHISESVLDHDYTLLAMKRYGEGAKEFWTATILGLKRMETNMAEPIKAFLQNDLRTFKESRRSLDQSQKHFDSLQSRYSAQTKTKEASSLREDAFQLHEARKAYLKASMDFSTVAPQLRMALDKMLVRVFADQWRDMRSPQQRIRGSVEKWGSDIDRVRGWSRELENGERTFKRELINARKQIEESAEAAIRPSRELDDYAVGSASASTSRRLSTTNLRPLGGKARALRPEKQGWLNLRIVFGKPSRTVWVRRWFYVKNGIFGWLVQGSRSGGVEESERTGVLLCNVKPGNSEDRRNTFEVKTKDTTIVLQAETQTELADWLAAFEVAKRKAIEDPASAEPSDVGPRPQDPAFAISPPTAPEFAASAADAGILQHTEDSQSAMVVDRSSTLPAPGSEAGNRSSFDVTSHRRSFAEKDVEPGRDPASKIIQKLDLHRRGDRQVSGSLASPGLSGGGIASLIAASHTSMPVGPGVLSTPPTPETPPLRKMLLPTPLVRDLPVSTLAPNTLAIPPAPTNLSSTAVIINGERGIGIGHIDASGGTPSGIMANIWGSSNWGYINRLARGELPNLSSSPSPLTRPSDPSPESTSPPKVVKGFDGLPPSSTDVAWKFDTWHRKTISLDSDEKPGVTPPEYPNYYPLQLKTQDAQFRLLFPNVRREEKPVLVFKATWNPNEQQDFPGRVYVTVKEIYFYSNHCGMTLISSLSLTSIAEITAASGKDCDFIFCHLREADGKTGYTRVTIKTFLEPLNLLQRRLNFLVRNSVSQRLGLEEVMKTLIKMEQDESRNSPAMDGWENVSINTPTDGGSPPRRHMSYRHQRDLRANVLIDRDLYGDSSQHLDAGEESSKIFKLPKQPVVYVPSGMDKLAVEKEFNISPKALFHVMFGDKSAVWQLLYHERRAQRIKQGPWIQPDHGHLRRDFEYQIEYLDILRRSRQSTVEDHQMVDVANEHLLYVVSDRKRPWHLPFRDHFLLLTKIVITHIAKSKCKLAVYIHVDWTKDPPYARSVIAEAALKDLELDALDLTDVIAEQVRTFADAHGRTKKAIQIFGQIGGQIQVTEFAGSEVPLKAQLRRSMKHRTLTALALEYIGSMSERVLTSTMQIFLQFIRWARKTIDANSTILVVLAFSLLANIIFSSSNTSEWWRERKVKKFMTKLGIGPDLTMSKAIYIHDLAEAAASDYGPFEGAESQCRDTFNEIMNLKEADAPLQSAQYEPSQTAAARQFQKGRQHLGLQRHDLLVAMRVVNSVEREMVQAEWENWLLEENAKCRQLGALIRQNTAALLAGTGQGQQKVLGTDLTHLEEIRVWHREYCNSCNVELELAGI